MGSHHPPRPPSRRRAAILAGLAFLLAGCATMTRGTQERVDVETVPSGASVTASTGQACSPTPCSLQLSRRSRPVLSVELEGHASLRVALAPAVETPNRAVPEGTLVAGLPPGSFAVAGRAAALKAIPMGGASLMGGFTTMGVGTVVDVASGAHLSLAPNPLTVVLAPLAAEGGE